MIRHWWQSTFLLFALFALVACSGSAPEVESALFEAPSATPIPPTSSPEPSATPFPTEAATVTPTFQPSPTATFEPAPTPEPTVTPEAAFEPWGVWPSQSEITAALQAEATLNNYPLQLDVQLDELGVPLCVLRGIATNPHFRNNVVIGDRFEITTAYNLYFDATSNPESKIAIPLSAYDREEDMFIVFASAASAMPGRVQSDLIELVFESTFSSNQRPLELRSIYFQREEFTNPPPRHEGGMWMPDVVALIQDALGVTEADIEAFRNTGDISHLPLIDGERWLFPSMTSN